MRRDFLDEAEGRRVVHLEHELEHVVGRGVEHLREDLMSLMPLTSSRAEISYPVCSEASHVDNCIIEDVVSAMNRGKAGLESGDTRMLISPNDLNALSSAFRSDNAVA